MSREPTERVGTQAAAAEGPAWISLRLVCEGIRGFNEDIVLSSDDPIRVVQRFATINAISNGRAEVILGRGSFLGSFRCSATTCSSTKSSSRRRSICSKVRDQNSDPIVFSHVEDGLLSAWIAVGGIQKNAIRIVEIPLYI